MHEFMYFFATSKKPLPTLLNTVKKTLAEHGYKVLQIHDFSSILNKEEIDFKGTYLVLDVFNASQTKRLLTHDTKLAMFLPLSVSIFTENDEFKLGMVSPNKFINELSDDPQVLAIAEHIDAALRQVIQESI